MDRTEGINGEKMEQADSFNERNYINILKAVALFSIVSAHVGTVTQNTCLCNQIFGLLLDSIGSIGVGVFFLISGYLFLNTKKSWNEFIHKKMITLLIPWVFCGTVLFLYVALRKGGLNLYNWFMTLIAYSHLYYLTNLMIFYLLFWRWKKNLAFLLSIMMLSIVSITLTDLGILTIYPYSNPLNWAIYFVFGLLLKRYGLLIRVALLCKKWFCAFLIGYVVVLLIYLYHGTYISYWKYAAIPIEIIAISVVFGLSLFILNSKKGKWIRDLGKMSFSIYLLHTPFAGIITNLCNQFDLWYLTLLRPFFVIGLTLIGIELARHVAKKIKMNKIVGILIGINRS